MDCRQAPAGAVIEVPRPAAAFARVFCTRYGHVLGPADGWVWTFPGSYAPVFLPAQMVRSDPLPVGHERHFTALRAEPLAPAELEARYRPLGEEVFAGARPKQLSGYRLEADSNGGGGHALYAFDTGAGEYWAYGCSPRCKPQRPFLIMRQPSDGAEP